MCLQWVVVILLTGFLGLAIGLLILRRKPATTYNIDPNQSKPVEFCFFCKIASTNKFKRVNYGIRNESTCFFCV